MFIGVYLILNAKTTTIRQKAVKLFGERINCKIRYQERVGAYGIIFHKRKLLLTEQITSENNIEIQLPGGGCNKNESLIHALYREVLEETGWGIKVLKKEGVFQRFTFMPEYNIWAHKVCHIYRCAATMQKTKQLEKNHRFIVMNKKKALETLVDKGFKYFAANV